MRVRISYSVDIDNVPQETCELLRKKAGELEVALNSLEDAAHSLDTRDPDLTSACKMIDKIRQKLADVDATLADCHGILAGLEEAYEQMNNPPPPEGPMGAIMSGLSDDPNV